MDQSHVYEIAGHFIEIVWKLPDGQNWQLPGFAPFLSEKLSEKMSKTDKECEATNSPENKLFTINIVPLKEAAEDAAQKNKERILSTFDMETGVCELRKLDNSYKFLIFTTDGKLSIKLEMETGRHVMNCLCALYEKPTNHIKVPDPNHLRFALWMAVGFAGIPELTAAIHSSVIIHENQAVLFLGESGTGKSTHTRLWLENVPGTRLLNDDSPLLRLHKREDLKARDCNSPRQDERGQDLKLDKEHEQDQEHDHNHDDDHENTLYIYGSPWSGKGKVYRNENYPVAAIVRLQQAPFNRATRLNVVQGFAALYPSFPPAYLKDENLHEKICTIISGILKTIPVYRLECLPKPSAVQLIYKNVFGNNKSGFEKMKKNYKNSHQKNVLFLPNENVLPLIEEQIAAGKSVKLRVRGNSMFPRLMDGRDMVALHHVDLLQIKVGDVIFFRWGKGFLMHRVIEIVEGHQGARPLKFVTRGDALRSTELVPIEDVIALAELPAHSPRTLRMRRVRGWLQRVRGLLRRVWGWVMRLLRR